jgi:hypothetical protein
LVLAASIYINLPQVEFPDWVTQTLALSFFKETQHEDSSDRSVQKYYTAPRIVAAVLAFSQVHTA